VSEGRKTEWLKGERDGEIKAVVSEAEYRRGKTRKEERRVKTGIRKNEGRERKEGEERTKEGRKKREEREGTNEGREGEKREEMDREERRRGERR
jgi:hypothetical protein